VYAINSFAFITSCFFLTINFNGSTLNRVGFSIFAKKITSICKKILEVLYSFSMVG